MVKDRLLVTIVTASGRTVCEGKSLSMSHKLVVLVLPRSRSRKRSSPQGSHVNIFATRHVVDKSQSGAVTAGCIFIPAIHLPGRLMAKHDNSNKSMIKVLFQAAKCSMRKRRYCLVDKGHSG
jgi:hypothetical protein